MKDDNKMTLKIFDIDEDRESKPLRVCRQVWIWKSWVEESNIVDKPISLEKTQKLFSILANTTKYSIVTITELNVS